MKEIDNLEKIENLKQKIKSAEQSLLCLHDKNISKNLKALTNAKRQLASFLNEKNFLKNN